MFIAPAKDDGRRVRLPLNSAAGWYVFGLAALVLLTGMWGANPLSSTAHDVASVLFP